jgi:hypothetical protein
MNVIFSAPSRAARSIRAVLAVTVGLAATFVAPSESGAAPTTAPAWVTLTASPSDPQATVSWAPVSGSVDTYLTDVVVDGKFVMSAQCEAPCTTRKVRNLMPGQSVRVHVYARTAGVDGPSTASPTIVIPNPCPAGVTQCIRIDGASDDGPVTGVAQGFLLSNGPGLDHARAAALNPRSWRVRIADGSYTGFDAARSLGAEVLLLVSDAVSLPATDPATSGSLPEAIATYRAAVRSYVQTLIADGRVPDWWEVQNEPDLRTWSAQTQLAQWEAAYQEIKALLPAAKILGPSPSHFMGTPAVATTHGLDLQTFLRFAAERGLRPDAIGWHENAMPSLIDFQFQPNIVLDHVRWARELLAANGMPDVDIRIDEYGGWVDGPIPGWQVGWFSALETARVDAAEHSCFPFPNGITTYDGCETPNLDNALVPTSQAPRANYWVELAYGRMSGQRLTTSASTGSLSTLAVAGAGGTISALVGRHVDCLPGANSLCPLDRSRPAAVDVPVTVAVPSSVSAMRVVVERVPFSSIEMTGPRMVLDTVISASASAVTVTLPNVADGDALILTLTPTSAPTTSPTTATTSPSTSTTTALVAVVQSVLRGFKLF